MSKMNQSPTALVILDGFGYRTETPGNAIAQAAMPTLDNLKKKYPWVILQASGAAVGLPKGTVGNSEVGHLTIGAGRIIPSDLIRLDDVITKGDLIHNKTLIDNLTTIKNNHSTLHLIGLLSDGKVHSHEDHAHALLRLAAQIGIKKVIIHPILDGRDVSPTSAATYLQRLEDLCNQLGIGIIGSLHGRFYSMDRDHNNDRTQKSFEVFTQKTPILVTTWQQALNESYAQGITDEFFIPVALIPEARIQPGDGVIFFNIRPDRARQLTSCFLEQHDLAFFITATRYHNHFKNPVLLEPELIKHTLLDEISSQLPQATMFVIAETEKYAHVTYFFRGLREEKFPNETQVMIPSRKVTSYTKFPEMSAQAITDTVITSLKKDPATFYLINYANADMVGHSGNLEATIKACEVLDEQIEQLYNAIVVEHGGTLFITADHGNAEEKIDTDDNPVTAHTTNPVMLLAIGRAFKDSSLNIPADAGLAAVAPLILQHLHASMPAVMRKSLVG